jgi:adenylate cyclase
MTATAQFREDTDKPGIGSRIGDFFRSLKQQFFRGGGRGPWWKLRVSTIIALSVLILGIGGRVLDIGWVELARVKTFDLYQRLAPRAPENYGVGIVDIDEKSLLEIGQWPWPRTVIADLINRLADGKAAVVGFDAVYPEYDRMSPDRVAAAIRGADQQTIESLKKLPRNEDVMAAAMKRMPTVVGQVGLFSELPEGREPPTVKTSVKGLFGGDPRPFLFEYVSYMGNVQELEDAATGHGFFTVWDEGDGVVRRVPLVARIGKDIRPALTVEMLRAAFGGNMVFTKRDAAGLTHIGLQTRQGNFEIPTDKNGRIWVHFANPDAYNSPDNSGRLYVSATDIINRRVPPEKLAGRLFVVGTSAVGLLDIRATPIAGRLPGVEVHANILETILAANTHKGRRAQEIVQKIKADAKDSGIKLTPQKLAQAANAEISKIRDEEFYLKYPNYANSVELAMILFAGLFMTIMIPRLGPMLTLSGIVVAGAALVGFSWYLYREHLLLIDVTYPGIVTMALYSVLTFANYTREAAEKKQVRGAFAQYLSPALVEQLADDPEKLQLGGETKEMTFLFCDVRGFTAISETFKSNPHGLTILINRLLTPLTNVILSRNGTIDKYMGDCIMAFWNAPLDDERHAVHACESALKMFEALDILNEERRLEAEEEGVEFMPLNVGAGINTGECVVGNMGSDQRFDYSVLGDPVNLAARLESQSKNYGVKIVIGEKTAVEAKDGFALLQLDLIQVKGQSVGVEIYALLGDAAYAARPEFVAIREKHEAMIAAYRTQHWDEAEDLLAECRKLTAGEIDFEILYGLYHERIEYYQEVPPPVGWDGVYIAETK